MSILETYLASNHHASIFQILLFFKAHLLLPNLIADSKPTSIKKEYDDSDTSYTLHEDIINIKSEKE